MNPKFVIPVVIVAIVAGLLFFFLRSPELDPGDRSNRNPNTADSDVGSLDPGAATEGEAESTANESSAESTEIPEDATPILIGQVSGGGLGIPDASVLLFPVTEIERSLLRMENLIPGGELPNIPELIASMRNELLRFKSTAISLRTDENGEYRLYGDHEGGFIVLSYAKGWLFHYGDVVSLLPETTSELFITLDEGASISGQVVRSSGQSVTGIKVLAEYRPPGMAGVGRIVRRALRYFNGEFLKGPFETRTDANGNFTISSLPPGTYDLLAYDANGLESYAPNVETGTNSAVIYFGEGGRVAGIVTDEFGMPLGRLPLTLERIDETLALPPIAAQFNDVAQMVNRFLGEPPREILTLDDGSFEFHPLGQGQYKLSINQSGFYPYKKQITLDWHEERNVGVIALPRGQAIRGVVISDRGEALEGATIIAARTDQAFMGMASTMTDFMSGRIQTKSRSDGSFELAGLQKGKYSVNATLGGYVAASENNVEPEGEPLELVLGEGGTLRGIVTDPTGQPVPGVRVRLGGARGDSDEEGRFVIRGVSPDGRGGGFGGPGFGMQARFRRQNDEPATGRLMATLKGWQAAQLEVPLDPLPAEVTIQMTPAPEITGVVLDPNGEPAPAALVRITPNFPEEMEAFGWMDTSLIFLGVTTTDLEGRFRFRSYHSFPGGDNFVIIADHVSYSRGTSEPFAFEDLQASPRELEVRLLAETTLEGVVTDGSQPIAGAIVRLEKPLQGSGQEMMFMNMLGLPKRGETVHTGPDGQYSFGKVQPGEYKVSAEMVGFTEGSQRELVLAEGDRKTIDLQLEAGGTIGGRVVDGNGVLIEGAKVRIIREADDARVREMQRTLGGGYKTVTTKEDGVFEFLGLPDDTYYTAIASAPGFSPSEYDSLRVGEYIDSLVLTPAAEIRGFVLDEATGQPIPDFSLRVVDESGQSGGMGWGMTGRRVANADGTFERKNLSAGRYTVTIRASGYASQEATIDLSPGVIAEETFRLGRAGRLRGRVVDANGQPISGVRVFTSSTVDRDLSDEELLRENWRSNLGGESVRTNQSGEYVLENFPEGARNVKFQHDDFVPLLKRNIEVPFGAEVSLDARLDTGLRLAGSVEVSDEQSGRFLMCRGLDEENSHVSKSSFAGDDRQFSFSGLLPGRYRVIPVGRRGTSDGAVEVNLTEDRNDVVVDLR